MGVGPSVVDLTLTPTASSGANSETQRAVLRTKLAAGMTMGSHVLLTTTSGQVDARLGIRCLRGKGAVSVAPGGRLK